MVSQELIEAYGLNRWESPVELWQVCSAKFAWSFLREERDGTWIVSARVGELVSGQSPEAALAAASLQGWFQ